MYPDENNISDITHIRQAAKYAIQQQESTFWMLAQCSTNLVGFLQYQCNIKCDIFKITLIYSFEILHKTYITLKKPDLIAQLAEHWVRIQKAVPSTPAVVRHIFQFAQCGHKPQATTQNSVINFCSHSYCHVWLLRYFTFMKKQCT